MTSPATVDNIAATLSEAAAANRAGTAVIEARTGEHATFAELDRLAADYAVYLQRQGIGPGDRVILMVRPSLHFIALTFALFRLGAPVILIDPGMGYRNLLRCIESVRPDHLIGIPAVIALSRLFPRPFKRVRKRFSCGSWFGLTGTDICRRRLPDGSSVPSFAPDEHALAAIIFTTGSTGPPKGVRYEHAIFAAQLRRIKSYYGIGATDIDQPGFPLFALFSTALGACSVIPDMDPTRPARVDPKRFVDSMLEYEVTYSFGSPAIWKAVSRYCRDEGIHCPHLQKVLMAGAPVSGDLIAEVYRLMGDGGLIFTPYGATESLPIVSIEGREVVEETWEATRQGRGTCVGRPLPGISVMIIEACEEAIESISTCVAMEPYEVGEIIVKGDVVTRAYENNEGENRLSKIPDGQELWHRLGDVGYLDDRGRLWFCGRKAHRVLSESGVMYSVCCEAIINEHPAVMRSALVGVDTGTPWQEPVLVVELEPGQSSAAATLIEEIREVARGHRLTETIEHVLIHPRFPVDIRHNAKIFREALGAWAQRRLQAGT